MTPIQERVYKKPYAVELLKIARGDLRSAETLRAHDPGRPENICYHAEQALEKSLKAALCAANLPIPLTHDLGTLLERIPKEWSIPISTDITELTQYATVRRYEEGTLELTDDDFDAIFILAKDVLTWAEGRVSCDPELQPFFKI